MSASSGVIDCRAFDDFCAGHLAHACSIPANELAQRMSELPDASVDLRLCGDVDSMAMAEHFLQQKGYRVVERMVWHPSMTQTVGMRSARLWQPSPLVQYLIEHQDALHISTGVGLDIACGSGRDTVALSLAGWQMTGIDVRCDILDTLQCLAASQQQQVTGQCLDLETGQDPFTLFDDASVDLMNVARYLHRPLFPYFRRLLKPNGVLLYHTFMVGSERFGSPKNPNFLLKEQELAGYFPDDEIILNDQLCLPDGRPMSMFIVRIQK